AAGGRPARRARGTAAAPAPTHVPGALRPAHRLLRRGERPGARAGRRPRRAGRWARGAGRGPRGGRAGSGRLRGPRPPTGARARRVAAFVAVAVVDDPAAARAGAHVDAHERHPPPRISRWYSTTAT